MKTLIIDGQHVEVAKGTRSYAVADTIYRQKAMFGRGWSKSQKDAVRYHLGNFIICASR